MPNNLSETEDILTSPKSREHIFHPLDVCDAIQVSEDGQIKLIEFTIGNTPLTENQETIKKLIPETYQIVHMKLPLTQQTPGHIQLQNTIRAEKRKIIQVNKTCYVNVSHIARQGEEVVAIFNNDACIFAILNPRAIGLSSRRAETEAKMREMFDLAENVLDISRNMQEDKLTQ